MEIRDRIKELRRVPAAELRPNPKNWRTHPQAQQDAIRGVLAEVGYAGALIARELPDGSLELIDGHLRAEAAPDSVVPVLVLDVSEAEADLLLASFDPLSAMAEADGEKLRSLLDAVETDSQPLADMLTRLAEEHGLVPEEEADGINAPAEVLEVIVTCDGEQTQKELYERLTAEGFQCRLLTF